VRNDAVRAQPPHLVGLVVLEVARKPFHVAVALEDEDVGGMWVERRSRIQRSWMRIIEPLL
jgi:hypothetical protein